MADTLDGNRQPVDGIATELEFDGCLDALEDTERRLWRRVATSVTGLCRQSGNVFRAACDDFHDFDTHADVFGGDVDAVQLLYELAVSLVQRVAAFEIIRLHNHRLAAPEFEAGHRVLVAHRLR